MRAESLNELLQRRAQGEGPYLEFVREESMSVGLYVLPAGAVDHQQPHSEDEVYVVLAGRGRFSAGDDTRHVGPGDTLFVPATEPHHFHEIEQELRLIVVFAPPEGTRSSIGTRKAMERRRS